MAKPGDAGGEGWSLLSLGLFNYSAQTTAAKGEGTLTPLPTEPVCVLGMLYKYVAMNNGWPGWALKCKQEVQGSLPLPLPREHAQPSLQALLLQLQSP